MGACGCGDFNPLDSFKVDDKVMATEIYSGCEYCDTGVIFSLYLYTPEAARNWHLLPEEEMKADDTPDGATRHYPLVGPEDLFESFKTVFDREYVEGEDGYESPLDFVKEFSLEILQGAFERRLEMKEK